MSLSPAVVSLCAAGGFLIVWLVFPAKGNASRFSADQGASATGSSSPPPEDDPEPQSAREDPPGPKTAYSSSRPRWCDILLLEPDASPVAIRKAYARLMRGLHPDVASADQNTSRQCALVQEAYRQAMKDSGARP